MASRVWYQNIPKAFRSKTDAGSVALKENPYWIMCRNDRIGKIIPQHVMRLGAILCLARGVSTVNE